MLKETVLIFLSIINVSILAYYEDRADVLELARAGEYATISSSKECQRDWNGHRDLLNGDSKVCVSLFSIPSDVQNEVSLMKESELENESDYDQRVTSLLAFEWKSVSSSRVSLGDIEKLAKSLNIPEAQLKNPEVAPFQAERGSFERFNQLFLGLEFKSNSKTFEYLVKNFEGQKVLSISFEKGVELYPGGGFYVTHYFFISQNKVIYVKLSWWNS